MWWVVVSFGLMLATNPASAHDVDGPRLSDRGRRLVAGAIGGYWSNGAQHGHGDHEADWAVEVAPSFTYFFGHRFGLGGYAGYGRERYFVDRYDRAHYDRISAGLQCLSELSLGPRLGLFFWVMVGYDQDRLRHSREGGRFFTASAEGARAQSRSPYAGLDFVEHAIDAALFMPLTVHLSAAVGLGFGPRVHWRGYIGGDESRVVDSHRVRVGAGTWIGASF